MGMRSGLRWCRAAGWGVPEAAVHPRPGGRGGGSHSAWLLLRVLPSHHPGSQGWRRVEAGWQPGVFALLPAPSSSQAHRPWGLSCWGHGALAG